MSDWFWAFALTGVLLFIGSFFPPIWLAYAWVVYWAVKED